MARTSVYLVRHGEQDRASGHLADAGLSELGREQAHRLGQRLRGSSFSAVHHSPLRRAAGTAEVIAGYLPDVPQHACDLVADRTPVPPPEQKSQYPDRYWTWLDGVPEQERDEGGVGIQAAIEHLGKPGTEDRRELVITHNFAIGWFVRHALDPPVWRWMGLNQANCGLTIVQWDGGKPPALVSFNDVGHLGELASV